MLQREEINVIMDEELCASNRGNEGQDACALDKQALGESHGICVKNFNEPSFL